MRVIREIGWLLLFVWLLFLLYGCLLLFCLVVCLFLSFFLFEFVWLVAFADEGSCEIGSFGSTHVIAVRGYRLFVRSFDCLFVCLFLCFFVCFFLSSFLFD